MKKFLIIILFGYPLLITSQVMIGFSKDVIIQQLNLDSTTRIISKGLVDEKNKPNYATYRYDSIYAFDRMGLNTIYYFDKNNIAQEQQFDIYYKDQLAMKKFIITIFSLPNHIAPAKKSFFKVNLDENGIYNWHFCPNLNNRFVFFTEGLYLEYLKTNAEK